MKFQTTNAAASLASSANKKTQNQLLLGSLTIKYLNHGIGFKRVKLNHSQKPAIHSLPSPTTKNGLMRFIGQLNIYSINFDRLHVNIGPLFHLLHDNVELRWNFELEMLFQQIETSIRNDITLTLHKTNHPFFYRGFFFNCFGVRPAANEERIKGWWRFFQLS